MYTETNMPRTPNKELIRCGVCGEPPLDGKDDQVLIDGIGVHSAETNTHLSKYNSVLLHKACLDLFVEGLFLELKRQRGISGS